MQLFSALFVGFLAGTSLAHPGHTHDEIAREAKAYGDFLASLEHRDSSHCHAELEANGHAQRVARRRADMVHHLRRKRNLDHTPLLSGRDLVSVLGKSHKSSLNITMNTPMSQIFTPDKSCVLAPEITEGPFYSTGEMLRQDLLEGQQGVPMHLDILVLDHKTCAPVTDQFVEIWSTNSTGIYGNVASRMNGNGNDAKNLNNTMMRGFQQLDKDGVVQFNTMVPGHYPIRANHVHIMVHIGATRLPNNTIQGGTGTISHVGQLFMDQSLLDQVEKTGSYATNKAAWTKNAQDMLISQTVANNADPMINYVLLGNKVEDGIFGFITVGVDTTNKHQINPATWWGASGGIKNPTGPTGSGGFGKREEEELIED